MNYGKLFHGARAVKEHIGSTSSKSSTVTHFIGMTSAFIRRIHSAPYHVKTRAREWGKRNLSGFCEKRWLRVHEKDRHDLAYSYLRGIGNKILVLIIGSWTRSVHWDIPFTKNGCLHLLIGGCSSIFVTSYEQWLSGNWSWWSKSGEDIF